MSNIAKTNEEVSVILEVYKEKYGSLSVDLERARQKKLDALERRRIAASNGAGSQTYKDADKEKELAEIEIEIIKRKIKEGKKELLMDKEKCLRLEQQVHDEFRLTRENAMKDLMKHIDSIKAIAESYSKSCGMVKDTIEKIHEACIEEYKSGTLFNDDLKKFPAELEDIINNIRGNGEKANGEI